MATANGILNGLKVMAFEFAETPRSTPENRRYFKEVLKVLLEDDTVVYNCVWQGCEFTRPSASGVWPHTKVHKNQAVKAPKTTPDPSAIDVSGLTLAELIERAQKATWYSTELDAALKKLTKATRELDEWKPRAKTAEQQLKVIRNAFAAAA
ncbi:hypothetical protein OG883_44050 [Streptomyces sp. NBC_01142]|uniref:hypothetical protein n=1 Tax=Streptomyces sp. NBC_01142 TaxID=2975865 RepID=UPI00224F9DE4|nr:hypothetical protein [Streptomyces sp. NBC_01142]MCX4826616.1 hypothetical protein [Streptomyces sp. NBC_01142]